MGQQTTGADPSCGGHSNYTQALFQASQFAAATTMGEQAAFGQTALNQTNTEWGINHSWTFHISNPSLRFSVTQKSVQGWMTQSQVEKRVSAEINSYFRGCYTGSNSMLMKWGPGTMSANERAKISAIIGGFSGNNLHFTGMSCVNGANIHSIHSDNGGATSNYRLKASLTKSCADAMFSKLAQAGCVSKLGSYVTCTPSNVTLLELTDHVAGIANSGLSANTKADAMQTAQGLLRQAQTSQGAAVTCADSGVQAAQNLVEQLANAANQDASLANATNSALNQLASGSIS